MGVVTTEEAFRVLKQSLQEDRGYAWSWHCNLAMAAYDEGVSHATANKAAARFMQVAFGVDTSKLPLFTNMLPDTATTPAPSGDQEQPPRAAGGSDE